MALAENITDRLDPGTVAVTRWSVPAAVPKVQVPDTCPLEPVEPPPDTEPLPVVTANVTGTPAIGSPN